MCLSAVTKRFKVDDNETEWQNGWKVIAKIRKDYIIDDEYAFLFWAPYLASSTIVSKFGPPPPSLIRLKFDKALIAWHSQLLGDDRTGDPQYMTGFHVFLEKAHADMYAEMPSSVQLNFMCWEPYYDAIVVLVKYRKIMYEGTQSIAPDTHVPCIVADELLIPATTVTEWSED